MLARTKRALDKITSFPRRISVQIALLLAAALSLLLVGGALLAAGQSAAPASIPTDPGRAAAQVALVPTASLAASLSKPTATSGSSPGISPGASQTPATIEDANPPAATPTPVPTMSLPSPTPTPIDHRFTVLLLGYGGDGHDGAYLTDAMMVVVVDPDQKTLTMLSLPRDLWVPLNFGTSRPDYNKINTAYAFARDSHLYPQRLPRYRGVGGAGNFAKDTVASVLGIPINYYMALDFQGFRDLIDAVGGVDVEVPDGFTAQYPRNDNSSIDPSWMIVHFRAGPEHMNGERALQYARAREVLDNSAEGSDFARANRQRIILTALKAQLLQPGGLIHLPQMLSIFQSYADTDYPLLGAGDLASLALSWGQVRFYQANLSLSNYLVESTGPRGEYILVPRAAGGSWSAIRAFARQLRADPALGMAMAMTQVMVVNRSGSTGMAGKAASRLSALGYALGTTETGSLQQRTIIRDQSSGQAGPLIASLGRDLGLDAPALVAEEPSQFLLTPRVVVELGRDALGKASGSGSLLPGPSLLATPTTGRDTTR